MGFLDKLGKIDRSKLEKAAGQAREKLGDAVDKHGDKIAGGIDKAAQAADKRTGGKHHDAIAKGATKAKEGLAILDELVEVDRLHAVVVGARLETPDAVLDGVARGQEDDRRRDAGRPQPGADREAVHERQRHVEHHARVAAPLTGDNGVLAVVDQIDLETGTDETGLEQTGELRLVLDQEDPHAAPLRTAFPSAARAATWVVRSARRLLPLRHRSADLAAGGGNPSGRRQGAFRPEVGGRARSVCARSGEAHGGSQRDPPMGMRRV